MRNITRWNIIIYVWGWILFVTLQKCQINETHDVFDDSFNTFKFVPYTYIIWLIWID